MIKKIMLIGFLIAIAFQTVSASPLFTCGFKASACNADEELVFYAHGAFVDGAGLVISSPTRTEAFGPYDSTTFNKSLCCKVNSPLGNPLDNVDFTTKAIGASCDAGEKDLIYFTNVTNGRIAYPQSTLFNTSFYTHKVCVKVPDGFSTLDILVNDEDYTQIGYTCIYKSNDLESSVVSDCDATFGAGLQYKYTAWARLWEDLSSLKCSNDCTSKLDGRVYIACKTKISSCSGIPLACDGALLNSWVDNGLNEVQCSKDWNRTREKVFSSEALKIEITDNNDCANLIKKEYPVLVDNELVTMSIYVCSN
ncbi:MAG: hypothetical protein KC550_02780 [Nanoarchaeota archaeon]|nr:hypothetical protein [Nanoarchaeota archaeon]